MLKIKSFRNLSPSQQKDWLEVHLYHELAMLKLAYEYLPKILPSDLNGRNSVILEIFLLHTRNLIEFFAFGKGERDSARARDFVTDQNKWQQLCQKEKNCLLQEYDKINKLLSHLTYSRADVAPQDYTWNLVVLYDALKVLFREFLNRMPKGHSGPKLRSLWPVKNIRKKFSPVKKQSRV